MGTRTTVRSSAPVLRTLIGLRHDFTAWRRSAQTAKKRKNCSSKANRREGWTCCRIRFSSSKIDSTISWCSCWSKERCNWSTMARKRTFLSQRSKLESLQSRQSSSKISIRSSAGLQTPAWTTSAKRYRRVWNASSTVSNGWLDFRLRFRSNTWAMLANGTALMYRCIPTSWRNRANRSSSY